MLKQNIWYVERIKIIVMMDQVFRYFNLITKFQKVQTKLLKFQQQ